MFKTPQAARSVWAPYPVLIACIVTQHGTVYLFQLRKRRQNYNSVRDSLLIYFTRSEELVHSNETGIIVTTYKLWTTQKKLNIK